MNKETMAGIIQKMNSHSGKGEEFMNLLEPHEKTYLEKIREDALRKMEETFKAVRTSTDIQEQNRKIPPKIMEVPLNPIWLANIPETQRNKILEIRKRQQEIHNNI